MIKLAVFGVGHWGPNHVRSLNSLPGSRVDAVADLDEGRLERVRETNPGLRYERDYRLILKDPNIDAVIVATPIGTHYEIVRESLLAGKHVLCEKPLCKTSEQGRELVELARTEGRRLMVGHVFLFNPGIVKLKELIDAGDLGDLRYLSASRANLGIFRVMPTLPMICAAMTSPSSTGCWAASLKLCRQRERRLCNRVSKM